MKQFFAALSIAVVIFISSLPVVVDAQTLTGTILGKIVTPQGMPVGHANVLIKELSKGAVTSDSGWFSVPGIPPGSYTLVVTSIGFERKVQTIEIKENEVLSLEIELAEKPVEIPEIVVTATRSEKIITNVPIPTSVVTEKQMRAQSAVRLNDLLAEQQGMFINFNQWGMGVQTEGLDPAYTLILVDGQPIVGRTAGTLELTRLSVGNIERVEVVKGPSSSLYGSEALAAVINLITKQPSAPFDMSVRTRYATNNSLDLSSHIGARQGNIAVSTFVERSSSDGYDLTPETESKTMPRSTNYSINPKMTYFLDEQTELGVSGRYVAQRTSNTANVLVGSANTSFNESSTLVDWSVAPGIKHRFSTQTKLEGKLYSAHYRTESKLSYQTDGSIFDQGTFNQTYNKAEAQLDAVISASLISAVGAGYVYETVLADRISGDERSASSYFLFGQQEWNPLDELDFIGSFRYDAHAEYAARFSPKVSALLKPYDWLSIRASVGSGFKAPTFQQLYLDFTNSQVGYSVFGSVGVREAFQRLQQSGQIQSVLVDPTTLEKLRPENSLAFNGAVQLDLSKTVRLSFSAFRNDLRDLIEAAPIATKNNGQAMYTYFNINRVFTQGTEAEAVVKPFPSLTFSASYQFLDSRDQNVLDDVRAGKIFKIGSTGRARPVQKAEYGGLFNRSAHSGTIKVLYDDEEMGLTLNIRGMLRSRYGYADNNGNNILDDDSEYAPGYAIWNLTCSKQLSGIVAVHAGVDNCFDVTNKDLTPFLPGRILYAGLALSL